MSFTIFYNEKTPFQAIKTRSSKRRKIDFFTKGLTDGFCPKNDHYTNPFFQAIQAMTMSFTIFQNEKTPCQAIKTKSSKTRNIDFFPNGLTHGFGPKMVILPNLCFQEKQARKIDIFPTGLTHGLGPKMAIFPNFFFQAIQARKISFKIFQNKKSLCRQ